MITSLQSSRALNNPNIIMLKDLSDMFIRRLRIHFKNGYQLSVIQGMGTYADILPRLKRVGFYGFKHRLPD